uniref:Prophenoloxidase n=1 Tax=Homarus gammarus TaxID=6707 RepID=Q70GP3_HOMGA|nr:prophenoloxidase [Homarus gammarus]
MSEAQSLLSLFEKPYSDVTTPRANESMAFELEERPVVVPRVGAGPTITLPRRPDADPSKLGTATVVPRGSAFSFFVSTHRRAAKDLCDAFMKTTGVQDLVQFAARVKDVVNESLFIYSLSFVILHKKELRNFRLPSLVEVFPQKFVPVEHLIKSQQEAVRRDENEETPIVIEHGPDFSSNTIKPEHRVAYWREDYGMNVHHWHWHLVYPIEMNLNRDRKGEIFFYMHQQMIARYDMERLSVGLRRVEKLENWRIPVPDGYFSKLTVNNSGRAWGTRQDNTFLKDFRRNDFGLQPLDITELEVWRSRLLDAIHQGYMKNPNGDTIPLSDDVTSGKRGIDILGDTLEADADLSPHYQFYGDLHNMSHVLISFSHDNDNAHKEELGVMGDPATSMRDPVFYRLHKFVDDVFQAYKLTQRPYTMEDLSMPGVVVNQVSVTSKREINKLTTGWSTREFEASRGIDFNSPNPVILRLTHLDSVPFNYHIEVTNTEPKPKVVTVRIFLAPKHNGSGAEMPFMEQRILWTEMDKFNHTLNPGKNQIVRSSKDSSITNPTDITFRDLDSKPMTSETEATEFDFCGCGWPQHLLLPRGKPEGMAFQLFYMITDFEKDKVEQAQGARSCANAVSFCGVLDAKFPDSRPMGFPFDRRPPPVLLDAGVLTTADYARLDNIMMQDVTITFLADKLVK